MNDLVQVKLSEHQHQVLLMRWAALSQKKWPPLKWLFAIPNGGQRNVIVAKKLKAEGVKRGVSDVMLAYPNGGYAGMFLELKADKGRATKEQSDFIADMIEAGYHAGIYHGFEAAKDAITWYLEQ